MSGSLTNYIAYVENSTTNVSRIGHLDAASGTIQPLSFVSGTPLRDLYQVIAAGEENIITGVGESPVALDAVKILPVISGRDILAVGKNYPEHATEFNRSGYDSSDKVDQPSHPVIFTKRATSIIAHGDPILPHPDFTKTLDYEGEVGVIIGKAGFQIPEADAWDYVWGYTIINDVTAREKQRDHKQFFIGKSADTFAPIVSQNSPFFFVCFQLTGISRAPSLFPGAISLRLFASRRLSMDNRGRMARPISSSSRSPR